MLDDVSQKFLVSDDSSLAAKLDTSFQELIEAEAAEPDASLIYVKGRLSRTTAPHGIHQEEVKRLSGACHYMLSRRRQLWFITIGDGLQQMNPGDARDVVADFLKVLVTKQKEAGLPQDYALVWHCSKGLHAHVICPANQRILDALMRSARFGQYLYRKWVFDVHGLAEYLSQECIPQAAFKRRIRRKRGSHQLPGGGDRVRLSECLKADAIAAGYVDDWQPTNAKRSEARAPTRPYKIRRAKSPRLTPQQAVLFPQLEKPPVRLRDFHGGMLTPAQAQEVEFRRQRLGLSQYQAAQLIGISQPHYANVVRGHDSMSKLAARHLRETLLHETALEAA